ncbi:MAG: TatD family hydrolase [Cyanobacteria bacterium P01_A01_bin.135]
MQLIDTHVHLNFDTFQGDLDQVAQQWREAGVAQLVHSCVEPGDFPAIQAIANRFPEIFFSVGLHPLDVDQWSETTGVRIGELADSDNRVVAIGELGLDFFKASNQPQQLAALNGQLHLARERNLPIIVHCRDAAEQMRQQLQQFFDDHGPVSGVMHCWSGSPEETSWFLDLGFYISFSGIATFKSATAVHESVKMVPNNRLLIETDCPFLAPVPKRGKRNQPAFVRHVAERVADLRSTTVEAIASQTTANARRLFQLAPLPQ